ncbi:envelope glycoprotein M [Macacine alphaherpesvirus 1]|nr:envelope glycoprotein M [Macacine alphaherpesvirus 1]ARS02096.1 envelope glycoprotein M [Macacine alphaherpesvirus 1]ARS02171.1 envelope glycoprotein M [Macacine alphaherpesvirus 1]ARS02246.1 envelope glycoprotein M [Macacine alphaherpesvirus 1]ARS02321.1 envelope glycoprotein M [Macacine alphaherpesvirus 1]
MGRPASRAPAATEGDEPVSRAAWWTWCVQVGAFVVSALCLVGLLIVAHFFREGFPCFYASAASYGPANDTAEVRGGVAAPPRLDAQSLVGTYAVTATLMLAVAAYVVVGATTARYRRRQDAAELDAAARMVATHATLLGGNACVWLLQITVLLLAHSVGALAHTVYVLHFACLAYFAAHFCTRGVLSGTYLRQVHGLMDVAPTHHRIVGPVRAVMTNALLFGALLCTAPAAVSVATIAALNFPLSAPGVLVCLAAAFAALVVLLLAVVEGLLSHYVRVLLGPHVGAIAAAGIVGVTAERYYTNGYYVAETQWPGAQTGVRVTLALVAFFALVMAGVRCVRAYLYHREHRTRFFRHMRDTKHRARSAIRRVRGSMRAARGGDPGPARPGAALEPIYSEVKYAGESDVGRDDDSEYTEGEHIYDEVASDPEDVTYARIQHRPRPLEDPEDVTYARIQHRPRPVEEPIYDTVREW